MILHQFLKQQTKLSEINMVGSVWNVTNNYKDGIVPWKVGLN